ncbi:hypothetical protein [Alteromonas sp. ASW11-130]|uniref:hypothetical protein n=1 Tax=Alteromonas sp. ASW11-130 TaxID=3015775 RepID=UPI002242390E|nr:hypothetical protein [Alteromonas sp. ASW11-130]MCW8093452.1 hypothetical protein [Alteromonas sp. ASW11-130]
MANNLFDDFNADLATNGRYYFEEKSEAVSDQLSGGIRVEAKLKYALEKLTFNGEIFTNWDSMDNARRYTDIRKANVYFSNSKITLGAGVDTFFWGVSESINVVNVLNQSDLRESLDGKVKLGQTFISMSHPFSNGEFSIYFLPEFRPIDFPERPAFGLPVSEKNVYENNEKEGGFATRALFYFSDYEFAVSYFEGTRRSPILIPQVNLKELLPYYIQTKNVLLDGVYLADDFTLKLEAKFGKERESAFTTSNIGIEYPSYILEDYIDEIIFIAEYVFDDRGITAETHGQNDIFIGAKFDFGETNQGNIRFLYSYDLDNKGQYLELNYQYRLSDYVRYKFKFISVLDSSPEDQRLHALRKEEFVKLSIHYAF